MNKYLKKILVVGASLVIFTTIGSEMSNVFHGVHASHVLLDQFPSRWERRDGITHWNVRGHAYIKRNGNPAVKYRTKTFYKHGHSFIVRDVFDAPGIIIGMDGTTHVSNAKVRRGLRPHHRHVTRHHRRKHSRRNYYPHHMYRYLAYNHDSYGGADNMTGRIHYARVQVIKIHDMVRHTHNPDKQIYTCRTRNRGFIKVFRKIQQGFHIRYQRKHGHLYVVDKENGGTLVKHR